MPHSMKICANIGWIIRALIWDPVLYIHMADIIIFTYISNSNIKIPRLTSSDPVVMDWILRSWKRRDKGMKVITHMLWENLFELLLVFPLFCL